MTAAMRQTVRPDQDNDPGQRRSQQRAPAGDCQKCGGDAAGINPRFKPPDRHHSGGRHSGVEEACDDAGHDIGLRLVGPDAQVGVRRAAADGAISAGDKDGQSRRCRIGQSPDQSCAEHGMIAETPP